MRIKIDDPAALPDLVEELASRLASPVIRLDTGQTVEGVLEGALAKRTAA